MIYLKRVTTGKIHDSDCDHVKHKSANTEFVPVNPDEIHSENRDCCMRCLFYSPKDLFKRGWSRKLIDELLGEPDKRKHTSFKFVKRYWWHKRVLEAEKDRRFIEKP